MALGTERKIAIIAHGMQPLRRSADGRLVDVDTDADGRNFSVRVTARCYRWFAGEGLLRVVDYTRFQTLAHQLREIHPPTAKEFDDNFKTHGIASPRIHAILPDQTSENRRILLDKPEARVLWSGEGTYDLPTLEDVHDAGYKAVIIDPERVRFATGGPADNRLARIHLGEGKSIVGIIFDKEVSMAFGYAPKHNADEFADTYVNGKLNGRPVIAITDMETFGWWWRHGQKFLKHLTGFTLADNIISVKDLDFDRAEDASLEGVASWSCPHGGVRWKEPCGCHEGWIDTSWKIQNYKAQQYLDGQITKLVKPALEGRGLNYISSVSANFERGLYHDGVLAGDDELLPLYASKSASLAQLQSCANFFEHLFVSGLINWVYAEQALLNLSDAGFQTDALRIRDGYRQILSEMRIYDIRRDVKPVPGDVLFDELMTRRTLKLPRKIAA